MRHLSQDAWGSIALELVLVPVTIKPMLPERTLVVCCSMLMRTSLGRGTIEAVALLNQSGSNTFRMVGLREARSKKGTAVLRCSTGNSDDPTSGTGCTEGGPRRAWH
jgi:hypothetical protein